VSRIRHLLHAARLVALAALFGALLLAVALGSAGIVALWSHPPGTDSRAELTWRADTALTPRLNDSREDLASLAASIDHLSVLARGALGALSAEDQGLFVAALSEGTTVSRSIAVDGAALRAQLMSLPGAAPTDAIQYGSAVLARRTAMLAALDGTAGLDRSWATLTAGSLRASTLIGLLDQHDVAVATAASQGRAGEYEPAIATLAAAVTRLDDAVAVRDQLANVADVSTLDSWIARNRRYDQALIGLYGALRDSGGNVNDAVRAAYEEEGAARALLPPDTRALVVIIADIGRGGLNQAVIAIEQARGRLNLALEALAASLDGEPGAPTT